MGSGVVNGDPAARDGKARDRIVQERAGKSSIPALLLRRLKVRDRRDGSTMSPTQTIRALPSREPRASDEFQNRSFRQRADAVVVKTGGGRGRSSCRRFF
jgi:hypothetical protein